MTYPLLAARAGNRLQSAAYLTASSLAINLLSLALPVMTLQIYDRIIPNPGSGTLPLMMAGVVLAVVCETALRLARSYMIGWNGAVFEYNLSSSAMKQVLSARVSDVHSDGAGDYLHRMAAIGKMKDFFNGYMLTGAIDLAFVPIYLAFIVYIAGPLAFVPAAMLMVFALLSLAMGQQMRRRMEQRDIADDQRYNFLIETLERIHSIKAFTLEKAFSRRYERMEEESTIRNYYTSETTSNTFNSCTVVSHILVICLISTGALLVLHGQITSGALVATLLLSGRMMQMVQRGLVLWLKYQDYCLSRDKVTRLFDMPVESLSADETMADTPAIGTLTLENITYSRSGEDRAVFSGLNFAIAAGETVALHGRTGSGKSTLLRLMTGAFAPSGGAAILDQRPVASYAPEDLARHIGLLGDTPVIFRGTIRHNITRFGEISDAKARAYAAMLGIDTDIARLPLGFDTFLQGNNNDVIPPGLKQRIGMARALAAEPKVLLVDGTETALDRASLQRLVAVLQKLKSRAAIVIVSSDPDLLALADSHCILHNGKISTTSGAPAHSFKMPEN